MFLFYINDIPDNIQSTVRLFADDTILYMTVKSEQDAEQLQKDIEQLECWEDLWQMDFHPEKCQVISVTRNRKIKHYDYTLHNHKLQHTDHAKYLGITITKDLRWNQHINNITRKANNTLAFLKRNININDTQVKSTAYKTLVRPSLEYASSVWDPYTKSNIDKIEMVQRRAARYASNRYRNTSSVSDMLLNLGWDTLAERREHQRLLMLYKMRNNIIAVKDTDYLTRHNRPSRKNNTLSYQIPHSKTDYHRYSFFPRTAKVWNILSENVVTAPSIEAFRKQLRLAE